MLTLLTLLTLPTLWLYLPLCLFLLVLFSLSILSSSSSLSFLSWLWLLFVHSLFSFYDVLVALFFLFLSPPFWLSSFLLMSFCCLYCCRPPLRSSRYRSTCFRCHSLRHRRGPTHPTKSNMPKSFHAFEHCHHDFDFSATYFRTFLCHPKCFSAFRL